MQHVIGLFFALAFTSAPKKPATANSGVELLSPTNATQLKAVFFSGDPWLVQCGSKADLAAASTGDGGLGSHEVVELALKRLTEASVRVGLLDCAKKLPSGKSTAERFKLDATVDPTLVLAANGQPVVQLVPSMLHKHGLSGALFPTMRQQASALLSLVKARAEKKATQLTKSEHLHAHCLKRKYCALALFPREPSGDALRSLQKLMIEYRHVAFATINTARYEFSLAKHLPQPTNPKLPQIVAFRSQSVDGGATGDSKAGGGSGSKKKSGDKKKDSKAALSVGAKAHRGEFALPELRTFLASLTADQLELTSLKKAPTIRWKKQEKGDKGATATRNGGRGGSGGSSGSGPPPVRRHGRSGYRKSGDSSSSADARQREASGGPRGPTKAKSAAPAEGEVSDEVRRRQKMAEEEEEYLRSMFGEAGDDEGGEGDEGDEDEEVEEEEVDMDEEEEAEELGVEEEEEGGGENSEKEEL